MNGELFFLVTAGGAIGASARFALSHYLHRRIPVSFPFPTFLINLAGSFLLGFLIGSGAGLPWQKLLGTGFLGGFTTFSTLHTESFQLLQQKKHGEFFLYIGLSYFLCIAGAMGGMVLGNVGIFTGRSILGGLYEKFWV